MCGDSTKAEDVARLMNGEQADLWLTDPPYNVEYVGAKKRRDAELGDKQSVHEEIENDVMGDEEYVNLLRSVFKNSIDVLSPIGAYYIWSPPGHNQIAFSNALDYVGLPFKQQLIWRKNSFVLGWNDYHYQHEVCFYGYKGKQREHYYVNSRNRTTVYSDGEEIDIDKMKKSEMQKLLHDILDNPTPTTVIDCPKPQKSADHPTMKPVRLFGYQIANSSRQGNIILDTFGGSGTTMIACEQLGRKARLMELDPHYCDVIIARWEKLTGQKAVKLNP
jgi:site-specific DNA-methyltransferase (adenine-specific)